MAATRSSSKTIKDHPSKKPVTPHTMINVTMIGIDTTPNFILSGNLPHFEIRRQSIIMLKKPGALLMIFLLVWVNVQHKILALISHPVNPTKILSPKFKRAFFYSILLKAKIQTSFNNAYLAPKFFTILYFLH